MKICCLACLQKFSGELHGEDGETFQDWKVQFEMVTSISKWVPQMKLANLVTRPDFEGKPLLIGFSHLHLYVAGHKLVS